MSDDGVLPRALTTVDRADPGDETFRRYRYQATYAATIAVGLLEDTAEVAEVYCEHHEDILLRLKSGKLRGIQVKTREDGAQPFRATDDQILDAVIKFLDLDLASPGQFLTFTLATNGVFDRSGKGHGNLHVVTAEARARAADPAAPCDKALALSKTILARIKKKLAPPPKIKKTSKRKMDGSQEEQQQSGAGRDSTAATAADVLRCLARTVLDDDLPKLPDIRNRLRDRLVQLSAKAKSSTLPAADRVVDALEFAAYLAASRSDEDRNGRLWFMSDPEARSRIAIADEIKAKCLSRKMIVDSIDKHCSGSLLVSAEPVRPEQIPQDLTLLEKKLVAGGLSIATLSMAHDALASLEELAVRNLYVYEDEALRRHNHARSIVKKECALAFESQAATGQVNGSKMLADVERRLKERRTEDVTGVLKECEEEHLLGHVFSLTRDCIVWWSTSRDLGAISSGDVDADGDDD